MPDHDYREATRQVLHRRGGLWFNDAALLVARRRSRPPPVDVDGRFALV